MPARPSRSLGAMGTLAVTGFVYLWTLACIAWGAPPTPTLSPADVQPEDEVLITITGRSFRPIAASFQAGRKARLVFVNRDAELHAFVPLDLLTGLHLNISGSGAPEFHAKGLRRLIIPPSGRAEIRFVPVRPGAYAYFCDMPGHQMSGTITVKE